MLLVACDGGGSDDPKRLRISPAKVEFGARRPRSHADAGVVKDALSIPLLKAQWLSNQTQASG